MTEQDGGNEPASFPIEELKPPTYLQDLLRDTQASIFTLEEQGGVVYFGGDVLTRGAYHVEDLQQLVLAVGETANRGKLYSMIVKWLSASGLTREQIDPALAKLFSEELHEAALSRLMQFANKGLFR